MLLDPAPQSSPIVHKLNVVSDALNRAHQSAHQAHQLSMMAASKAQSLAGAFFLAATQYGEEIKVIALALSVARRGTLPQ